MFALACYCACANTYVRDVWVQVRLGCNSELILDEFGEKLLEELDYQQEARNIQARATQHATPTFAMNAKDTCLDNSMLLSWSNMEQA